MAKEPELAIAFRRGSDIAIELTKLKVELGQLGLLRTMHALDEATRAIGYELEEKLPRTAPTPLNRKGQ